MVSNYKLIARNVYEVSFKRENEKHDVCIELYINLYHFKKL